MTVSGIIPLSVGSETTPINHQDSMRPLNDGTHQKISEEEVARFRNIPLSGRYLVARKRCM
jgi:hypothetical protein